MKTAEIITGLTCSIEQAEQILSIIENSRQLPNATGLPVMHHWLWEWGGAPLPTMQLMAIGEILGDVTKDKCPVCLVSEPGNEAVTVYRYLDRGLHRETIIRRDKIGWLIATPLQEWRWHFSRVVLMTPGGEYWEGGGRFVKDHKFAHRFATELSAEKMMPLAVNAKVPRLAVARVEPAFMDIDGPARLKITG